MPRELGALRRASSSFSRIHLATDLPLQGAAPSGFECAQPTVSEDAHALLLNQVSWGAIFTGVVVAWSFSPADDARRRDRDRHPRSWNRRQSAASTFSVVTGPLVRGVRHPGCVRRRLYRGSHVRQDRATTGALHGLTTWAFTTLLVLYLLSTAVGSIVGGAFSGVANAVGGTWAPDCRTGGRTDRVSEQSPRSDREAGAGNWLDPEALNAAATNAIRALVTGDEADAEARVQAAQALSKRPRYTPRSGGAAGRANRSASRHQTVDQTQRVAAETADTAPPVVSIGALLAFVALVLGAIAGWLGEPLSVVHPFMRGRMIPTRRTAR